MARRRMVGDMVASNQIVRRTKRLEEKGFWVVAFGVGGMLAFHLPSCTFIYTYLPCHGLIHLPEITYPS